MFSGRASSLVHGRGRSLCDIQMLNSTAGPQAHFVLETLAYLLGAKVYWVHASKGALPAKPDRILLLGCTILGALVGSKLLHVVEHFESLMAMNQALPLLAGKSVLGGFLGGTFGSELGKKVINWTQPTGDAWVPALTVGLVIGRIGCQLSGTWDQPYGIPTDLPWAWNYGDGVGRHPAALYEIILVVLAFAASGNQLLTRHPGARFAFFLLLYSLIRLLLEFLKPPFGLPATNSPPVALYSGLTAIQWAALVGVVWFGVLLKTRLRPREVC